MGILSNLFNSNIAEPVEAVGNVLDKLFTSDEEKAQAAAVMEKIRQHPHIVQTEINKIEAGSRHWFVASWRPAIGWVCAIGLMFPFVINPCIQWWTGQPGPEMPTEAISTLIFALLGLGGLRTVEKFGGKSK